MKKITRLTKLIPTYCLSLFLAACTTKADATKLIIDNTARSVDMQVAIQGGSGGWIEDLKKGGGKNKLYYTVEAGEKNEFSFPSTYFKKGKREEDQTFTVFVKPTEGPAAYINAAKCTGLDPKKNYKILLQDSTIGVDCVASEITNNEEDKHHNAKDHGNNGKENDHE